MKQLIVLIAMLILGIHLFSMIAGGDEKSVSSTLQRVWIREAEMRRMEDSPEGPA
ncbi:MAG TPA: hypothetical protein GX688_04715 [Clostridiales bacterium]|jgi:hypothetical protein|nr:hypothetical protein [Clostridiales bacterium]